MDASLRIEILPADVDVTTSFYERLGFQVAGRNDVVTSTSAGKISIRKDASIAPSCRASPRLRQGSSIGYESDPAVGYRAANECERAHLRTSSLPAAVGVKISGGP